MNLKTLSTLMGGALLLGMTSCGSKTLPMTIGSENLRSLVKVTEGKNPCDDPAGSPGSNTLFFTMKVDRQSNIYRKDNPVAPAQVQVTSGTSCLYPSYNESIDRVAFSRLVNGFYDIYMMPVIKGNALIPVTETPRDDEYCPSISPDGTMIAYQKGSFGSTDSEIWIKNITSGENMLLGKGVTPSFSPDGKKIAYAKVESSNTRNIWVMDIDGSNAQQLTVSKDEFAGYPKWSPSGNKIVFQSNKKKGNFDIFVMNANGTGTAQLTSNESEDKYPYWAGDGYIYFVSDRGARKGEYNIWRFMYDD